MLAPRHKLTGIEELKAQCATDSVNQQAAWIQISASQMRMEEAIEGLTRELSQTAHDADEMSTEAIKSAVVDVVTKAHGSLLEELGDKTDEDNDRLLNELRDMKNAVLNELCSTLEVSLKIVFPQVQKFEL